MNCKHGMADTPIYKAWQMLVQRCTNPKNKKYPDYGGRGITVCRRWLKFENFYADMGDRPEGHSIERKNNNKGYSKSNCVWADANAQAHNKRNNVYLEYAGDNKTYSQWARDPRCCVSKDTLRCRIKISGWEVGAAITTPNLR